MKIGFVLTYTSDGFGKAFSINESSACSRSVGDVRSAIEKLDNFVNTGRMVYLLRFLGSEGYLFTLIKDSGGSGRASDNTSAWIHIPARVDLDGKDMKALVDTVAKAISNEYETDNKSIEDAFNKDFPEKKGVVPWVEQIRSEQNGSYAVRYFGKGEKHTLEDLLGNDIAQCEYAGYQGVFFVEKSSGVGSERYKEIKSELRKIVTLPPLKEQQGFVPRVILGNGQPIPHSQSIEIPEGTTVFVQFQKNGYEDIKREIVVKDLGWSDEVKIEPKEVMFVVELDKFKIIDHDSNRVTGAKIRIDGEDLNSEICVPEASYQGKVAVRVTAPGHAEWKNEICLAKEKEIEIKMKKEKKYKIERHDLNQEVLGKLPHDEEITLTMVLRKNESGEITMTSKHEVKDSPLKGYKIDEKTEKLKYDEGDSAKYSGSSSETTPSDNQSGKFRKIIKKPVFWIGFTIVVLLLVGGGIFCLCSKGKIDHKGESPVISIKEGASHGNEETSSQEAALQAKCEDLEKHIHDLNTTGQWKKSELDSLADTKGMYEELCGFQIYALSVRMNKMLGKLGRDDFKEGRIKKLYDVVDSLLEIRTSVSGSYTEDSSGCIKVDNYIESLLKASNPMPNNNKSSTKKKNHATGQNQKGGNTSPKVSTKTQEKEQDYYRSVGSVME